ncbi:MAG: pirin family protein [Magnetospirillum sp.]|nr:pirin family protein [Magnetospirillum sp.]
MTIALRPSEARGHANHGWLDSFHTFSFAHYYDPAHMGFRSLRVINDDVVRPGAGFATHGHRDMEIVSYVVRGALAHEDTTGGKGVLRRGDVQVMSAGTGLRHSEYNGSRQEEVRFLQIWILPPAEGLPPSYDQRAIPEADKRNRLAVIAAPDGAGGTLPLHQDAWVYASLLDQGATVTHKLAAGRGAWVQVVDGALTVNGSAMKGGDGLAVEDVERLDIAAQADSEFLLFDLA